MNYNGLTITSMSSNINKSDKALLLSIFLHNRRCKNGKAVMKFDRKGSVNIISSVLIDNDIERILLSNPQKLLLIYNKKFKLKEND